MSKIVCFVPILLLISGVHLDVINVCADWTQYKDEKCIKVVRVKVTEEEAVRQCQSLDSTSTLVSIHSSDEQQFIANLAANDRNISTSAWIGLTYSDNTTKYEWIDKSATNYTNWSNDAVKDGSDKCVQMMLNKEQLGYWLDESCKRTALVICQRKPQLDLGALKNAIIDMKAQFESKLTQLQTEINIVIPMGFLYTQLPGQSDPSTLWPTFLWTEVTKDFAGLFFRAEGGNSATFGVQQSESSPRLSDVYSRNGFDANVDQDATISPGSWSRHVYTGGGTGYSYSLSFYVSNDEVRPVNKAVKIWKRTG